MIFVAKKTKNKSKVYIVEVLERQVYTELPKLYPECLKSVLVHHDAANPLYYCVGVNFSPKLRSSHTLSRPVVKSSRYRILSKRLQFTLGSAIMQYFVLSSLCHLGYLPYSVQPRYYFSKKMEFNVSYRSRSWWIECDHQRYIG